MAGYEEGCVYDDEGTCSIHGRGASKFWKPSRRMVKTRRGGIPKLRYEREHYFVCDLGTRGRGRLRQTTLSFWKTTPQDNTIPHDDAVLGRKGEVQTDDAAE